MVHEPDWEEVKRRMSTLKRLKPVTEWFCGCSDGETRKDARIGIMVVQMAHWWNHVGGGVDRVKKVLEELRLAEEGTDGVRHRR